MDARRGVVVLLFACLAASTRVAAQVFDYPKGECVAECWDKNPYTTEIAFPGKTCAKNKPCGAKVFVDRQARAPHAAAGRQGCQRSGHARRPPPPAASQPAGGTLSAATPASQQQEGPCGPAATQPLLSPSLPPLPSLPALPPSPPPASPPPRSDDVRNMTRCVADYNAGCDEQPGCVGCALWDEVTNSCTVTPFESCTRAANGRYAVLKSRESPEWDDAALCLTVNHWMVVPTIPCTGIDSPDPRCTGPEGEDFWGFSWDVAMEKGFPPSGSNASTPGPDWGIYINSPPRRSQHQMHIRVAALNTGLDAVQEFIATAVFSTNARWAGARVPAGLRPYSLSWCLLPPC